MEVSAWQRGVVDRETGMRSPPSNYLPSRVGPAVIAVIGGTSLLSRKGKNKIMSLDLEELRQANLKRSEETFHSIDSWSLTDWACAAAGEMGEACNLIKKRRRGEDINTEDIADEIADTLIYLDLLSSRLGEELSVAVRRKFNVVSERTGSNVFL